MIGCSKYDVKIKKHKSLINHSLTVNQTRIGTIQGYFWGQHSWRKQFSWIIQMNSNFLARKCFNSKMLKFQHLWPLHHNLWFIRFVKLKKRNNELTLSLIKIVIQIGNDTKELKKQMYFRPLYAKIHVKIHAKICKFQYVW